MKATEDLEYGKKLILEHYKVGHWYKFQINGVSGVNNPYKIMKIDKVVENPSSIILKGTGFIVNDNGLMTPSTNKDEIILFYWAEHYIGENPELSKDAARAIYDLAIMKTKDKLFND